MNDQEHKEIVKQAIKEWMNERAQEVGWWFIRTLLVAGVTSFLFWYAQMRGYKLP
jgi:hypothetical protein